MTRLTKQALRENAPKRQFKEIELPGGVKARIRNFSEGDSIKLQRSMRTANGKPIEDRQEMFRSLLIAHCWVDDDGQRVLTDDDVMSDWWLDQDAVFVATFFGECIRFSGWNEDYAEAVEAAAKNFEGIRSSSSEDVSQLDSDSQA